MLDLRSEVRISLAAATVVAVVALPCAPAVAQGPPPSPPGLAGGEPPGQAKKEAAAAPLATAPAPAADVAPAAAVAPAPTTAPAPSTRAAAPGQVKKAAREAARTRPAATPVASTTTPIAASQSAQPAPAPASQPAAAPARRSVAKRRAAQRQRAARRTAPDRALRVAAPAAAVVPIATAQTPPAQRAAGSPTHRTRTATKPAARPKQPAPTVTRVTRTITRTVNDIVEVFPTWAKVALAALGLSLLLAGALIAAAAHRHRRLRRERARLLDDIGVLQEALLPRVPATVGALAVSVAYRPAQGLAAGGDFYDVFPLENGSTGIILGDVSGHGRESLGSATFIRHMVRSYLEAGLTPRASIQLAGNVLDDHKGDDYATIVAGVHDPAAGTLSYATAGHPPPIVAGLASFRPLTVASSPPAGAGVTTGLRQTTIALPPNSTVCFFTDGLTEARVGREDFGRERLEWAVEDLNPDATAEDLIGRIANATDPLRDDVAVCLIRTGADAPAGTVRVEEIEVTMSDLRSERLQRFFEECGVRASDAAAARKAAGPHVAGFGSVLLRVRLAANRSGVDVVPVAQATSGATVIPVSSIR